MAVRRSATLDAEIRDDSKYNAIVQSIIAGKDVPEGFSLRKGSLFYQNRIEIPKNSARISHLLRDFHDSPIGGHSGSLRTYKRLAALVYWEGMKQDVQRYVARCEVCQRNKYQSMSPAGLLQPLPIPLQVWEDISMDFIVGLPRSQRFDTILVIVDRFSKYSHFAALSHPFTAKEVAELFTKEVIRLHGFPKSIVSDRDRIFLSQFWKELFKLVGTSLKYSSGYHPETDGQTEVVNRSLETYLRCFAGDKPKTWAKWLPWAEFWFNSTYNRSIGMTPFQALYGREPPTVLKWEANSSAVEEVNATIKDRNLILAELKHHLERAQEFMKEVADKKRRGVEFQVGDFVYLKLRPYRFRSLAKKQNEKLAPRFYGPYEVLDRYGKVAYKLKLPDSARIHPVFHVSQLKQSIQPTLHTQQLPMSLTEEMELEVQPESVRKIRSFTDGRTEVLIHWQGLPDSEDTWEDYTTINTQFPTFHLEDKVQLVGDGNDGPGEERNGLKWGQVYTRKNKRQNVRVGERNNHDELAFVTN